MGIEVWCRTDKGKKRSSNQDSFFVSKELGLFVVADGMGGHSGGEIASAIAVKTAEEVARAELKSSLPPEAVIQKIYEEASARIFDKGTLEMLSLSGMGTTMVLALVRNDYIYIGNVGDSRAYLHVSPFLWQVTEDHSLMNEQIKAGVLKENQAHLFQQKNVITRSVGYEREVASDVVRRNLSFNESYLLCSDGLSGLVSDQRINEILNQNPADQVIDRCIQQALLNGGDDNVTVLHLKDSVGHG